MLAPKEACGRLFLACVSQFPTLPPKEKTFFPVVGEGWETAVHRLGRFSSYFEKKKMNIKGVLVQKTHFKITRHIFIVFMH